MRGRLEAIRSPGRWLQALALLHVPVGVALYPEALRRMRAGGVVNSVADHGDESTVFWFLLAAPLLWSTGHLLHRAELAGDRDAQRVVGAVVGGTGVVATVVNPESPFWLVAAVGVAAVRRGTAAERLDHQR